MRRLSLICFLSACAVLAEGCSNGAGVNMNTGTGGGGGDAGGTGNSTGTGGGNAGNAGAGSGGQGAGGIGGSVGTGGTGTGGKGGAAGSGSAGKTGGGGAGGKAGSGGVAGTGGAAGSGGTPGTGGSALTCSGTLGQPTAPVIVTATLRCNNTSDGPQQVSVGAGSANSGFVALLGDIAVAPGFFFDISPSAVQVQQVPSGDAISLPSNASGAFGVLSAGVDRGSISWSSRSGTGTGQLTATTAMDTMSSSSFIDGALGPDGTQYAAFERSDTTLALLSRQAGGSAFAVSTVYSMLTPYWPRLVVDAGKAPHFLSWIPAQGLVDSPQGQALVTLFPSTLQQAPPWRPTRPGGLDFAVSVMLADGVHVLRRGTGSAFDDIPIPGTPATNAYVSLSPITCDGGICNQVTQMGDYASSAALARASDGTLWLVTFRDHLDRTIPYKYNGGEACQCQATLVPADDHSTHTLAVQRIAPGATAPSAILWSQDVSEQPWTSIAANTLILDASFLGSSLFFTIMNSAAAPSLVTVSYYVMDTTGLH
jgi:hypothetical protein